MQDKLLYEIAIGLIPRIGNAHTKLLISYCGSAENVFRETKGKLLKIPGIGQVLAESITTVNKNLLLKEAESELIKADKNNTRLLFYTSEDYPSRLKNIYDAPAILYYKGNATLNSEKVIGIVGTRNATEYGKEQTAEIVKGLKSHNPLIVSGLAYGIDIAAHRACLDNDIATIGIMASGMDIIYPSVHKEIAQKMLATGGLITENKFGQKPDPNNFPERNRIIAGMCDVVIVVEAGESGGALITAELANGYNREVVAVPGKIGDEYSTGCNNLIKDHKAHIYTKVSDIEYLMNWEPGLAPKKQKTIDLTPFTEEEQSIILLMQKGDGALLDDLSWKSQLPVSRVASLLLNLEFQGLVKSLPGKKYKLL